MLRPFWKGAAQHGDGSLLLCCPCEGLVVVLGISIVAPLLAVAGEVFLDFCVELIVRWLVPLWSLVSSGEELE